MVGSFVVGVLAEMGHVSVRPLFIVLTLFVTLLWTNVYLGTSKKKLNDNWIFRSRGTPLGFKWVSSGYFSVAGFCWAHDV